MAKFGIALEWGSRGLEFESRHSDQKPEITYVVSGFFFSVVSGFEHFNVTVRGTFTRDGLTEGNRDVSFLRRYPTYFENLVDSKNST